ncbi:MAG: hypothetical protein V5A44_04030 [Haloarculaceae archaeon]
MELRDLSEHAASDTPAGEDEGGEDGLSLDLNQNPFGASPEAVAAVRDCTGHGLPRCVRVSCGTRTETERAVDVLDAAVETVRN